MRHEEVTVCLGLPSPLHWGAWLLYSSIACNVNLVAMVTHKVGTRCVLTEMQKDKKDTILVSSTIQTLSEQAVIIHGDKRANK